jgi:hypothetical protein
MVGRKAAMRKWAIEVWQRHPGWVLAIAAVLFFAVAIPYRLTQWAAEAQEAKRALAEADRLHPPTFDERAERGEYYMHSLDKPWKKGGTR